MRLSLKLLQYVAMSGLRKLVCGTQNERQAERNSGLRTQSPGWRELCRIGIDAQVEFLTDNMMGKAAWCHRDGIAEGIRRVRVREVSRGSFLLKRAT